MYYTYCYLTEDRKPYYVGKGRGDRAYDPNHSVSIPPRDRILILKDKLTEEDAFKHEVYMIDILGRKSQGGILENIHRGGKQPPVFVAHSEQTKTKMRQRRHSEETKRKIGIKSKAKMTEQEKQKLSDLWKGRPLEEETKRKISQSMKGKPKSEETKRKMREAAKRRWQSRAS
tara:strand:+ start:106 stop:624 length:519 start_codon:yes stop_codon:yes gene_type:complete